MKTGTVVLAVSLALIAVLPAGSLRTLDPTATVTLHANETHQTMTGWEATARLWEINKEADRFDQSSQEFRDEIFSRLVNELGINRLRIEIRSGMENPIDHWARFRDHQIGYTEYRRHYYEKVNDNNDPNTANPSGFQLSFLDFQVDTVALPLARLLEARGEKLFVTLTYVDFRDTAAKGSLSHALNPEEYAELIDTAFDHLKRRYGLTPDALEITLEPENTEHWRGRQIGEAMVATARRFARAGIVTRMIAPSTTAAGAASAYFDDLMKVPGAASILTEFSFHHYDGSAAANRALPEIAKRAATFGLKTAMLEHLTGDAGELYADLTVANASAWQQYAIATKRSVGAGDKDGYYYILETGRDGRLAVRMTERSRSLAQYFRFIRAGAVRLGTTSTSSDTRPVAFKNADGTYVVVAQADGAQTMTVLGLPAGIYGLRYTTATETGRELPVVAIGSGRALTAVLPAPGIITVYQKKSTSR